MQKKYLNVLISVWRSFIWTFSTIVIGLSPVWLKKLISLLHNKITYNINDILEEGCIMIFSMTLIAAVLIDIYINKTIRLFPPDTRVIIGVIIPFIAFVSIPATFVVSCIDPQGMDFGVLRWIQSMAFIGALIYSFGVKLRIYNQG